MPKTRILREKYHILREMNILLCQNKILCKNKLKIYFLLFYANFEQFGFFNTFNGFF